MYMPSQWPTAAPTTVISCFSSKILWFRPSSVFVTACMCSRERLGRLRRFHTSLYCIFRRSPRISLPLRKWQCGESVPYPCHDPATKRKAQYRQYWRNSTCAPLSEFDNALLSCQEWESWQEYGTPKSGIGIIVSIIRRRELYSIL